MPEPFKDVVVVIPGILGSRLVRREGKHETTVWDLSVKGLPRALLSLATGALALASPERPPDDGVVATDLYSFQLLPGLVGVDDYAPLVALLKKAVSDPLQLITFPYDWRGSNRFSAERLERTALAALGRWKAKGNSNAKLWLVCHSMGGLVARYFCEHLGGAEHTRAIVTFGTPHRGATKALNALSNGLRLGPIDVSKTVRSLPSVYELLPLYPVVRVPSEVDTLEMHRVADFFGLDDETGADASPQRSLQPLPGLDRDMLQRSLDFHAKIRAPAEQRQRDKAPPPYIQRVFFNRRQPTLASCFLGSSGLEMYDTYPEQRDGAIVDERYSGDGTVPAFAAMPIEWPDTAGAMALVDKHAALQCAEAGLDTLFNWLRPIPLATKKGRPDDDLQAVSLGLPPTVALGDSLPLTLASQTATPVTVTMTHADGAGRKTAKILLSAGDAPLQVEMKPDAPGAWRISVQPDDRLRPAIADWVFVFER